MAKLIATFQKGEARQRTTQLSCKAVQDSKEKDLRRAAEEVTLMRSVKQVFLKLCSVHRKIPALEYLINNVVGLQHRHVFL